MIIQSFKDLYYKEIQNILSCLGFEVNIKEQKKCAKITMMGSEIAKINDEGVNIVNSNFKYYYNSLQRIASEVKEYVSSYYQGDDLIIGGKDKWKKITEFNNIIFAVKKITEDRYEFATWQKDNKVVKGGRYYTDYYFAKQDMAKRSGLIDEDKLLSEKELKTIYSNLMYMTNDKQVEKVLDKISRIVPRVEETCREFQLEEFEVRRN